VSFSIKPGEILGIAGVEGNGQSELIEAIMGIRPITAGSITLHGEPNVAEPTVELSRLTTRARRQTGIGYIPEDRSRQALLLDAPLWENRILGHQTTPPCVINGRINRSGARADTQRIIEEFDVRTPGVEVTAGSLSGGNQQKLIVGREMSGNPRLVIAAHPTRGVDIGAQEAIWELLRDAQRAGLAVLLVSADLDELTRLSSRIIVLLRGRIAAEFLPDQVSLPELGAAMTGAGAEG
jgi:simple sugar transport system ATP-binding protein